MEEELERLRFEKRAMEIVVNSQNVEGIGPSTPMVEGRQESGSPTRIQNENPISVGSSFTPCYGI